MRSLYMQRLSNQEREGLRERLRKSQGGKCFICDESVDSFQDAELDVDHIVPTSVGGKDHPDNFALTHRVCNRRKQASDLRVAQVLAKFSRLADQVGQDNRSPNLGDVLKEYGGSKYTLPIKINDDTLTTSFASVGSTRQVTFPVHEDRLSGCRSSFLDLPIEYLHHDDHINPRALGRNLRKLVEEFHKQLPQLHVALTWIDTSQKNGVTVRLFDGQHKAAAQILLGVRTLPIRVFIDPDTDVLLRANTHAGTTLRQVAFDMSVQRSLGSSILSNRIDLYRQQVGRDEDDESFSEQDLVNHFRGEGRQMRRYVVDRVRNSITTHPNNKLSDFIERGGRGTGRPLGYSAVERTFYKFFIDGRLLSTPFNYKFEDGINPRQLEIHQTVRLMNIVADEIFIGQFEPGLGTSRIERYLQAGKDIPPGHLRAFRMSREEVLHGWLKRVRDVVVNYLINTGAPYGSRLFQQEIPEQCWDNVRNFIVSLARLPLWLSKPLGLTAFGGKRNYDYWSTVFDRGESPDGVRVMVSGLNLVEMIKADH